MLVFFFSGYAQGLHILFKILVTNSKFCFPLDVELVCAEGLRLWRNSATEVNNELYRGYRRSNLEEQIEEIAAGRYILIFLFTVESNTYVDILLTGYDFLNSNGRVFNVSIWYNSTYKNDTGSTEIALARIPRSVNLVRI